MTCSFCGKDREHLIEKNNLCICDRCVEQCVNTFINNGVNIKLKIKNFKIKGV